LIQAYFDKSINNFIIVQVYVGDIIFGVTNEFLYKEFLVHVGKVQDGYVLF